MTPVRVVAVGSPFGADAIAWDAARVLAADLGADARSVDVRCLDRPGPGLIDALAGAEGILVIDALCGGPLMGELVELEPADLAPDAGTSSHGLGVGDALRLAEALGIAPQRLTLLGIAVDPRASREAAWMAYARRGRAALAARVRRAVEAWVPHEELGSRS